MTDASSSNQTSKATQVPEPQAVQSSSNPVLNSVDLFKGTREVSIKHGEEFYRLRLTKSGKLILHK